MRKLVVLEPAIEGIRPGHKRSPRKFSVIEIFGPTIQGEGPDAGKPCYFIRFGGCDYRCSWCDSMYAVEPAEVREHAEKLTRYQICERVEALPGQAEIVVLSGGNPALFMLNGVVRELQDLGYKVSVETQGSKWRPWLANVDRLVISPKPPSSGMTTPEHGAQTDDFMRMATSRLQLARGRIAIKIVVFDEADYEWALAFHERWWTLPFYLSVGTDQLPMADFEIGFAPIAWVEEQHDLATVAKLRDRYRWLAEKAANDPRARKAIVLPQMHVLAWGTARGV